MRSPLTSGLGLQYPIVQAPMAGGATTPELVAAVCNAGGLGSLAAGMLSPPEIADGIAAVRRLTDRAFNVNFFVLEPPAPAKEEIEAARARLEPYWEELGLAPPAPPERYSHSFSEQVQPALDAAVPLLSFTFGMPPPDVVEAAHRAGSVLMGTATSVAEARALAERGVDAICAQGAEAGAHRGTFLGPPEQSLVGTVALVPQVVDAVPVPVVAAGGIMDGRGVAAALVLGAVAAQLGTAFLGCPEARIHPGWKAALGETADTGTTLTRAFTGKMARGIVNRFAREMAAVADDVPDYPLQNALTAPLRAAAARADRLELLSLWAGQGAALTRALPAAELVAALAAETRAALGSALPQP